MARDAEGLKLSRWGPNAATKQSPEAAGLTRLLGWPDSYGEDDFPPLGVFNQVWLEITSLLVDIAEHGVLHWSANQRYEHDPVSYVVASDKRLYQSVQASGGDDSSLNPILDTAHTHWRPVIDTTSGRIAAVSNATLELGTNNQDFVTAAALLSLFKATPNDRWRATTGRYGLARFGTQAQIDGGDAGVVVTADILKATLDAQTFTPADATTSVRGIARLATLSEARAGTNSDAITTPEGVKAALDNKRPTLLGSANVSITATNVLVDSTIDLPETVHDNDVFIFSFGRIIENGSRTGSVMIMGFDFNNISALVVGNNVLASANEQQVISVRASYTNMSNARLNADMDIAKSSSGDILVAAHNVSNDPMPMRVLQL